MHAAQDVLAPFLMKRRKKVLLGYAYIDLLAKGNISINQKQFAEQTYE